jgi:predicted RNA-binding Zn ribbon-like protein
VSDAASRRAAFTLRLDAKRHLKLRLASTVRNRSAQQLVTEALDRFLNDIPEIEALAAQVRRD